MLRERLFKKLDTLREHPVIWLGGPPGCGKTILATSYIKYAGISSFIWYQVDADDNDEANFFHYLSLAGKNVAPRMRKPLPSFNSAQRDNLQRFARQFFRKLYERLEPPAVVVFDNLQDAFNSRELNEVLHVAMEELPEGINIIVISHNRPSGEFSRLYANGQIKLLDWGELRLTPEESKGLAETRDTEGLSEESITSAIEKAEGWAAGLVLLLERANREFPLGEPLDKESPEILFDYFLREIFNGLNEEVRVLLIKTALFPTMSVQMAVKLTGISEAGMILSELNRKNYFTYKTVDRATTFFQYHYLFRLFLLSKTQEILKGEQLVDLQVHAARLLEAEGLTSEAASLYQLSGEWDSLASLIKGLAKGFIKSGRNRQLENWISSIPANLCEADPWLLYWKASSRLSSNPTESILLFEDTYSLFREETDIKGVLLSICGAVSAVFFESKDLSQMDKWIRLLDELCLDNYEAFLKEVDDYVVISIFYALMTRMQEHPDFDIWKKRTIKVMEGKGDQYYRVMAGSFLLVYFTWKGEYDRAAITREALNVINLSAETSPFLLTRRISAEQLYYLNTGDHAECVKLAERGLALAEESGFQLWDSQLLGVAAVSAASHDRIDEAAKLLDRMLPHFESMKHLSTHNNSIYYYCNAWVSFLRGENAKARGYGEKGLERVLELSGTWFELMPRIVLFYILNEIGERDEAYVQLEECFKVADLMDSDLIRFMGLVGLSKLLIDGGDEDEAKKTLTKAMGLGRKNDFFNFCFWHKKTMNELCSIAFSLGIEKDYVKELIRRRGLAPEGLSSGADDWPWPIKVHTFGRFELLKDDTPLVFAKKAPKKPLELLKALVALGGSEVNAYKICDMLWADSDGDAASRSLITNLSRLRKLLGFDHAIVYSNGRLTLDSSHIWVDIFRLEDCLNSVEEALTAGDTDQASGLLEEALVLYKGEFLVGESGSAWALNRSEGLKSKLTRIISALGQAHEMAGELKKAIGLYDRGLSIDSLKENFCYRKMFCYKESGLHGEAISEYRSYKKALSDTYGIDTSPAIRELYESILSEVKIDR